MTRDQRLQIRLTQEEKDQLERYAKYRRLDLTSAARTLMFSAMDKDQDFLEHIAKPKP